MTIYLDLSALQSVPAANLNRDDLGSPSKCATATPRIRVSSQSWKRAIRLGVERDLGEKAARTRLVPAKVQHALESAGWPPNWPRSPEHRSPRAPGRRASAQNR
ncbi:type I-E CRISPR-associated protein Cas7/Cse4/CasC [Streptomyces thermocarboxydus]